MQMKLTTGNCHKGKTGKCPYESNIKVVRNHSYCCGCTFWALLYCCKLGMALWSGPFFVGLVDIMWLWWAGPLGSVTLDLLNLFP